MASQITSLTIVYSTVYSGADQRKHQSSALLAFVREIHQWPVNSPHKGPVTQKMFPFDDVIMCRTLLAGCPWGRCFSGVILTKRPCNFRQSSCIDIKEINLSLSEFQPLNGEYYLKKSCQVPQMTLVHLSLWNQVISPEMHNFYNILLIQIIQLTILYLFA